MFPVFLADVVKDGHLTLAEANAQYLTHQLAARTSGPAR